MDNNNLMQTPNQTPRRKTRSLLATGGVLAALGAGYAIGTNVNAQQGATTGTPAASAPVVNTPATRDAASMQDAFAAVAKAAEPAVVTITTQRKLTTANRNMPGMPGSPRVRPFGGGEGGRSRRPL